MCAMRSLTAIPRSLLLTMSVLQTIWGPPPKADTARKTTLRGLFQKVEADRDANADRERGPRRKYGVKAHLKAWAAGECSAVCMWRLCTAVCNVDGTKAGLGMARLAGIATERTGGEQTAIGNCWTYWLIQPCPN